jgi:ADP-ribosyl-[dinitrogen reductase] hydrolase
MEDRPMNSPTKEQRILGGLYGSLVGDALGVPVEFRSRTERKVDPVLNMRDYGTHNQPKGTWSDDGALLLCSVESFVTNGFNTQDMGERFVRWLHEGHWAAHGKVFDIGGTTNKALDLIAHGCAAEVAGGQELYTNGNGSLMRILPTVLAVLGDPENTFCEKLERTSAITHAHEISKLACTFHGMFVRSLMQNWIALEALKVAQACFAGRYERHSDFGEFRQAMSETFADTPELDIDSGGYVLDTLTASIWCLLTTDNFSDCVLKAVNLGGDTDTTGCVAGGLAGVYYGHEAIPQEWLGALPKQAALKELFAKFVSSQ